MLYILQVVRYFGYDRHQPPSITTRRIKPALIIDAAAECDRLGIRRHRVRQPRQDQAEQDQPEQDQTGENPPVLVQQEHQP
jgi:hypothetical protein